MGTASFEVSRTSANDALAMMRSGPAEHARSIFQTGIRVAHGQQYEFSVASVRLFGGHIGIFVRDAISKQAIPHDGGALQAGTSTKGQFTVPSAHNSLPLLHCNFDDDADTCGWSNHNFRNCSSMGFQEYADLKFCSNFNPLHRQQAVVAGTSTVETCTDMCTLETQPLQSCRQQTETNGSLARGATPYCWDCSELTNGAGMDASGGHHTPGFKLIPCLVHVCLMLCKGVWADAGAPSYASAPDKGWACADGDNSDWLHEDGKMKIVSIPQPTAQEASNGVHNEAWLFSPVFNPAGGSVVVSPRAN
jgi:hypothetical protein